MIVIIYLVQFGNSPNLVVVTSKEEVRSVTLYGLECIQ